MRLLSQNILENKDGIFFETKLQFTKSWCKYIPY